MSERPPIEVLKIHRLFLSNETNDLGGYLPVTGQ